MRASAAACVVGRLLESEPADDALDSFDAKDEAMGPDTTGMLAFLSRWKRVPTAQPDRVEGARVVRKQTYRNLKSGVHFMVIDEFGTKDASSGRFSVYLYDEDGDFVDASVNGVKDATPSAAAVKAESMALKMLKAYSITLWQKSVS